MSKKRKRTHPAPPQKQTPQLAPNPSGIDRKKALMAISLLLVVLVAGGAWAAFRWSQGNAVSASQSAAPQTAVVAPSSPSPRAKVVVSYFHGTARCPSCELIERYAEQAVREGFSPEMKRGLVEFKSVNVQTPENRHVIKDYQLYAQSVIVSDVLDGKETRWKNLPQIWQLFMNEKAFKTYVQQEITTYLQGKN